MNNAFQAVEDFEAALREYTGAPYAIAVDSCTNALMMVCEYLRVENVTIPKRTYRGVPQAIVRSGGMVFFDGRDWSGGYDLRPYPIWDYARRFTSGMYRRGQYQCLSFHRSKVLGHTRGGAILCDNLQAAVELRMARYDAGIPGYSTLQLYMIGFHTLMEPGIAAELHAKLHWLPKKNEDLPNSDYPDLSLTDWNGLWKAQRLRLSSSNYEK